MALLTAIWYIGRTMKNTMISRWTFWQTERSELAVNAAVAFRNRSRRASGSIAKFLRDEMRTESRKAVAAARKYAEGRL